LLRLSKPTTWTVTADYGVGGTATPGTDYTTLPGGVTFNAGETTKSINVTVTDDALDEPDKTVVLTLTGATGAALVGNMTRTLTIQDNDPTPRPLTPQQLFAAGRCIGEISPRAPRVSRGEKLISNHGEHGAHGGKHQSVASRKDAMAQRRILLIHEDARRITLIPHSALRIPKSEFGLTASGAEYSMQKHFFLSDPFGAHEWRWHNEGQE
jgi:hypothetical protein